MKQKELEAIHAVTLPHEPTVLALADIARQLTIIADAQEQIANPLIRVDKDGHVTTITPASPDANICFEILAKAFFYDTKMMAPGKMQAATESSPGHSIEERQDAWHKWLKENDVPEPAPDALTTIAGIISKDFSSRLPQNIVERLEAALPAEVKS